MHIIQALKTLWNKHFILIGSFTLFVVFGGALAVFANPPVSPYQPGETLDPNCNPGDPNCTVQILRIGNTIGAATAGRILFVSGTQTLEQSADLFFDSTHTRLGVGTDTPDTFTLEVAGDIGPSADNTYNLGSSNRRFNTIYATSIVGTITPSGFTDGSIAFVSGGTFSEDNANFFWNNNDKRLGIGTATPTDTLDVNGTVRIRSIANATGNFITTSATGILQQRTPAEVLADINAVVTTRTIEVLGTTNQVTVTGGSQDLSANRTWTIALPQDIHTGATPTFSGITLSGITNGTGNFITIDGSNVLRRRTAVEVLSDIGAEASFLKGDILSGTGISVSGTTGSRLVGNGNITITLNNTTVTPGTYGTASGVGTFTVDAQGRLTSASTTAIAIDANQITTGVIADARLSGAYTGFTNLTGSGTLSFSGAILSGITNGTGNFITIDGSNVLRRRTAAQVLTDIGAPGNTTEVIFNNAGVLGTSNRVRVTSGGLHVTRTGNLFGSLPNTAFSVYNDDLSYVYISDNATAHSTLFNIIDNNTFGYASVAIQSLQPNGSPGVGFYNNTYNINTSVLDVFFVGSNNSAHPTNPHAAYLFNYSSKPNAHILFGTNLTLRWSILRTGEFESNGAQTIRTSTGNLTLATNGGNGNIIFSPNGTGAIQYNPINGSGDFITVDGSNLLRRRTAAQVLTDINAVITTRTISTTDGIAGGGNLSADRTFGLTGQALALHTLGTNGIITRTGVGTVAARILTGTVNQITITNGDGITGNPTFSLPQDIHTGATPTFSGITLSGITNGTGNFITIDGSNVLRRRTAVEVLSDIGAARQEVILNYRLARELNLQYKTGDTQIVQVPEFNDPPAVGPFDAGASHGLIYIQQHDVLFSTVRNSPPAFVRFNNPDDLTDYDYVEVTGVGTHAYPDQIVYSPQNDKVYMVLSHFPYTNTRIRVIEIDPVTLTYSLVIDYNTPTIIGFPTLTIVGNDLFIAPGSVTTSVVYKFNLSTFALSGSVTVPADPNTALHSIDSDGSFVYAATTYNSTTHTLAKINPATMAIVATKTYDFGPYSSTVSGVTDDILVHGQYIYLPLEGFNAGYNRIARINKNDFDDIKYYDIDSDGMYTIMGVGKYIYYGGINALGRLDPTTNSVEVYDTSSFPGYSVNEFATDGTRIFFTGFDQYPVSGDGFIGRVSFFEGRNASYTLNANGQKLLRVDKTNSRVGINTTGEDYSLQVGGNGIGVGNALTSQTGRMLTLDHLYDDGTLVTGASFNARVRRTLDSSDSGSSIASTITIDATNTANWTGGIRGIQSTAVLNAGAAGTISNLSLFYAAAPTLSWSGTLSKQVGLYVEDLTGADINYAIETAGTTPSFFGGWIQSGNLRLDTNTLSSQDINGNIILSPNGTGLIELTGERTLQTSTGNFTLATNGGNGNIILSPNGTGLIISNANISFPDNLGLAWNLGNEYIRSTSSTVFIGTSGIDRFAATTTGIEITAPATANPALFIPVFTADPASTLRSLSTRTPAQFLSDIGGAPSSGSGNYIQNQYSSAQTAEAWISGRLRAGNLQLQDNTITAQSGSTIILDPTAGGRVGIGGTPDSGQTLDVRSTNTTMQTTFQNVASSTNTRMLVSFVNNNSSMGGVFSLRTYGTTYTADTLFSTNAAGTSVLMAQSSAGFLLGNFANGPLIIGTNNTERWRIDASGVLQANGAQTLRTSTGNLTLTTGGGNGALILSTNGTGSIQFNPGGVNRWTLDTNGILESAASQQIRTATGSLILAAGGANSIAFRTNGTERWQVNSTGIFEASGAQTIRTASGNLTLASNGGNGGILLQPNGTGSVRSTADIFLGDASTVASIRRVNGATNENGFEFRSGIFPGSIIDDFRFGNGQGDVAITSSTRNLIDIDRGFNPTSGSGVYNMMQFRGTINQTGTANGVSRAIWINPTLTSAVSWRSIEWSNNAGFGLFGAGTALNYLNGNLNIGTLSTTSGVGRLNILNSGASTPTAAWLGSGGVTPLISGYAEGASGGTGDIIIGMASNTDTTRSLIIGRKSRGTLASPAVVQNNDTIFSFLSSAFDGTNFQNPAQINFLVDGIPSSGSVPARISLVTGTNATDRLERLVVKANGNIGVNVTDPLSRFHVQQTASAGIREQVARFGVSDATTDLLLINNGTISDTRFAGVFAGMHNTGNNLWSIGFQGYVSSANDTSDSANFGLVDFYAARSSSTTDPLNGTQTDVVNRRMFTFRNATSTLMTIMPNGNVSIGTGTTAPATRLEVMGITEGEYFRGGAGTVSDRSLRLSNFTSDGFAGVGHNLNAPHSSGVLSFSTNSTERWRIASNGILQSNGAQTIQSSTGNLTLATNGGDGNIVLDPHGTGVVSVVGSLSATGGVSAATVSATTLFASTSVNAQSQLLISNSAAVYDDTQKSYIQFQGAWWSGDPGGVSPQVRIGSTNVGNGFRRGAFVIETYNDSGYFEAARFNNTGNLLIGTTTDAGYKLDVNGGIRGTDIYGSNFLNHSGATTITSLSNNNIILSPNGTGLVYSNSNFIIGGEDSGTPSTFMLRARGSSATDTSGSNLIIAGGYGRGAGNGGEIIFQTAPLGSSGPSINPYIERMRINQFGNVGIGTTTNLDLGVPGTVALSIGGSTLYGGMQIRNSSGNLELFVGGNSATDAIIRNNMNGPLRFGTNGAERVQITAAGRFGIGNTIPGYLFHTGSNTTASGIVARFENQDGTCDVNPTAGTVACTSDGTVKKNITSLTSSLALVNQLRPVTFNWIREEDGAPTRPGFIAQEVEVLFPEIVYTDAQGRKSLGYASFVPYLTLSIQELDIKIEGILTLNENSTFVGVLRTWLASASNGIGDIFADRVRTKELCIEDVCVTKDQLQALLQQQQNAGGTPAPQSNPAPELNEPEPEPVILDDSENTPEPEPEPTPDPVPEE